MSSALKTPIIITAWIATAGVAFYAGSNRSDTSEVPEQTTPSDELVTGNKAPTTEKSSTGPNFATNPDSQSAGDKPASASSGTISQSNITDLVEKKRREAEVAGFGEKTIIPQTIREALDDSDPISRMSVFTEALQHLGPHNVQEVLQQFKDAGETNDREFSMFLYAWAKFDGAAAMDYTKQNNQRGWQGMQNSYSAMSGFAAVDPQGAEAWARENFEGQDNPYLIGVINGVAKTDLAHATEITQSLPYGRIRGRAVDTLLDGYFKQGNEAAMAWASNLEEGVLKNGIVSRVTGRLTREDPTLAASFVDTLAPGEERNQASVSLAEGWSRSDPKAAAEWVVRLSDDQVRAKALEESIDNWARRDKEAAGAFLKAQPPGPYLDGAVKEYAERLRFDDPVNALTWAATITNEDSRHKLMERIAEEWSERDPEAAAQFLNQ
jgi:hypothetical protein